MNNGKVVLIKILLFQNALHISVNYAFQKKLFFFHYTPDVERSSKIVFETSIFSGIKVCLLPADSCSFSQIGVTSRLGDSESK